MLTKEKVLKNAKKFNDTGEKYGVVNTELLELLGEGFISAPCTSKEDLYGAYEGGLIEHIINVTKHAIAVNDSLPAEKQVDHKSIIRVALLHQIGKCNMFIPQSNNWRRDNLGENYTWNDTVLSMSVAERSVYYALKSGIDLTEDEVFAIYNYNSEFAQRPMTTKGERLGALLRIANMIAMVEVK